MLADPAAIKVDSNCSMTKVLYPFIYSQEVASSRYLWPKPIHLYKVLSFFGRNIVVSEGEEWKKYRKISAPAFSEVCSTFS